MAYTTYYVGATGDSFVATYYNRDLGQWWNDPAEAYTSSEPEFASKSVTLTEGSADYIGSYSGSPSATLGTGVHDVYIHDVSGTNIVVSHTTVDLVDGVEVLTQRCDATEVIDEHTHYCDGYQSRSIIELKQNFAGTLALVPDLVASSTIDSVVSVALTGAASVTGTNLRKSSSQRVALYDVAALSTTGTYTVTATIITTNNETIVNTGTVIVS